MKLSLSCLALWQPEWVCLFRVFWPPQDLVSVRHYYAGILQVNIFTQPLISSCFLQLICVSRAYHALDRSETLFACANQHSEPIAKVPVPPNQPRNRRRLKWLLTSHTDHYLLFDVGGLASTRINPLLYSAIMTLRDQHTQGALERAESSMPKSMESPWHILNRSVGFRDLEHQQWWEKIGPIIAAHLEGVNYSAGAQYKHLLMLHSATLPRVGPFLNATRTNLIWPSCLPGHGEP